MTDPAVLQQPWLLYALGILLIVATAAGLLPKISSAWAGWLDSQRRLAADKDDADIAELKRQLEELQAARRRDRELRTGHLAWDREVYRALSNAGHPVEPPPPLF